MSDQPPTPTLPEWAATLPDDIKPIVQSKGWKDPADVAKSYVNLEKTLGTKRLPAPSQDWKPEQWDSFYKELGRPESPDKYGTPEVKLPDGVALAETDLSHFKGVFHKAGLLPHQAEAVMKSYYEWVGKGANETIESRKREQEAAEFKLRDEWKGEYDGNLKLAKDTLAKFGDEEAVKVLNESGLGNHPGIAKLLAKVGKAMLEDSAKGKAAHLPTTDSDIAKGEIVKLKQDKAFMDKFYSGDKESVAKWQDLHKKAYGNEPLKSS